MSFYRILVLALSLAFIGVLAVLSRRFGVPAYFPWGFSLVYFSLYVFWEYNRVRRAKRAERREHLDELREALLGSLRARSGGSPGE
jgi:hypothetical protein